MQLPTESKKGRWVIAVLLLAGGIFLGTRFNSNTTNKTATKQDNSFQYTASVAQQALEDIKSTVPTDNTDSDQDGLPDAVEVIFGSNPNLKDTDGDGYTDGQEVDSGFSPTIKGTDGQILNIPAETSLNISGETGKDTVAKYLQQSATPDALKSSTTYSDAVQAAQKGDLTKINQIIVSLQDSEKYLTSLSIPAETSQIHLLTLGLMPNLIDIFLELKTIKDNPKVINTVLQKSQNISPFIQYLRYQTTILSTKYNLPDSQ